MPARVNRNFVIGASVGAVLVLALASGAGYYALKGRGDRNVARGDALAAQGKYDEAAAYYARAVGGDQTNRPWLEKWRDALVKTTPERREYDEKYRFYLSILQKLAMLSPSDPEAQITYIKELDAGTRIGGVSRESLERLIRDTQDRSRRIDEKSPGYTRLMCYRALAQVDRMGLITVEERERHEALEDLQNAIDQSPREWQARLGIVRWHSAEAERLRKEARPDLVEVEVEAARRALGGLLEAIPNQPEALLAGLLMDHQERLRKSAGTPDALRAAVNATSEQASNVLDAAMTTPTLDLRGEHVARMYNILAPFMDDAGLARLQEMISRVRQDRPADPALTLVYGQLLIRRAEHQAAIEEFQKVIDLPDPPVSLEGVLMPLRRMMAAGGKVDAALEMYGRSSDDQARAAAMSLVKKYRDELEQMTGVRGRETLLWRDAQIAVSERQPEAALKHLTELRRTAGSQSLEVLGLLAEVLMQQNNLGEARRVYMEMLEQAPNLAMIQARLGEIALQMRDMKEAQERYTLASQLEPANQAFSDRVKQIRTATGQQGPADQADPMIKGAREAREMRDRGQLAEARQKLEDLWATRPGNKFLLAELIQIDLLQNKKDEAIERVRSALRASPNDLSLKKMLASLEIDDPIERAKAIIEGSDLTPGNKQLELFQVFLAASRPNEAAAALEEAERVEPDNPRVIDLGFVAALGTRDMDKAQRLAQRAAEMNIDQVQGLLYQGRIQLVEGKDRDAVLTFERALKELPYSPDVRRLLGQAYSNVGRSADALTMFQRAYEARPDDIYAARDYAQALTMANRCKDALAVIGPSGALRFAREPDTIRFWLDLETRCGDRARVLAARRELMRMMPNDTVNGITLARMLIEDGKWTDARDLIGQLNEGDNVAKLDIALLEATLITAEPDKGGVEAGLERLRQYIGSVPEDKVTAAMYLAMGDFLLLNGQVEEAIAAMRQARKYQDPKRLEADRRLGDVHFDRASAADNEKGLREIRGEEEEAARLEAVASESYTEAVTLYNNALTTVQDQPALAANIRKRLAETYLRLDKPGDAQKLLEVQSKETPDDLQVLLLQASVASRAGDKRTARQKYDRAVELYPSNPATFFQRARFNQSEKSMTVDVLQDFEQVTRLRPGLVAAWVSRYEVLRDSNQLNAAFAVLSTGIDANPGDDDLRLYLVRELFGMGRDAEAQAEMLKAVKEREGDLRWLRLAAQTMARAQRWPEAAELFNTLYDAAPSPQAAGAVLDTIVRPEVNSPRPRVAKLYQEFEKVADNKRMADVLLKARVMNHLGQKKEAQQELDTAATIIGSDPRLASLFFNQLLLLKEGKFPEVWAYIDDMSRKGDVHPFLQVSRLGGKIAQGETPNVLIAEMEKLEPTIQDDITRLEGDRLLSRLYYMTEQFQRSADYARKGLEIAPNDLELTNNLAYTLISHLNDPEAGLPYAQRAAQLAPPQALSNVLDTLGWAYYGLKQYSEAKDALTRAVEGGRSPEELCIAALHLGKVQIATGSKADARRSLRQVEENWDKATAGTRQQYGPLLESLRKDVE